MAKKTLTANRLWIGAVAVAVGGSAFVAFADRMGVNIDRPVWRSEFIMVAGPSLHDLLLRKERRLWELDAVLADLRMKGLPISPVLVDERNLLRREIEELTRRARALR